MSAASTVSVYIETLGCAKNEVDSADMADQLAAHGYQLVQDSSEAQVIIVNTCAFIQSATEESLSVIFEALDTPQVQAGSTRVVVAGCMPARYGDDLASSLTEVTTFVPCNREKDIVAILDDLYPERSACVPAPSPLNTGSACGYVKISDGCNRFCSYCAIPYIRGRYHSFTLDQIVSDTAHAVARGAREITLIAQDTGRWGTDFDQPSSLAALLDALAKEFPETWFRVLYIQPEGITDELLSVMKTHQNVCSYLDIPLQHCNEKVLADMNRKGSTDEYLALISRIRDMLPEVTLRTTLIAGFPGESEEQFAELCDFVEDIDFDYVGVFAYSQEEGTRAASLPGQLDQETKDERAQTIRDIADSISTARVSQRVDREMDVLVIGREEDDQLFGRAQCQAPEVDGVVYLDQGNPGDIVRARIVDTLLYEMEGEVV